MANIPDLVRALEERGLWAEAGDEEYLVRFGRPDSEAWLVLMYDHGITWEPAKAYPTPCYCKVSLTDVPAAADKMVRVLAAYESGSLSRRVDEGEKAADAL